MTRALVLLCMAIILPLVRCHKIHEHMTREEMLSVFYTGHESVPPYEVVPVLHTMHKRSIDAKQQIHLKAFGKDISLSLKPTEGLLTANSLPMWTVTRNTSQPDGLHYERVKDVDVDIGDIYQDTENMASILLHQDTNGKVRVDGTIGSELVIRPLPERVLQEVVSKAPALGEPALLPNLTESDDLRRTSHHIVFRKVDRPAGDEYSDFSLMEPDHLAKRYRMKRSTSDRSKREAPYVIYPEILCIVDYDGYRLHGGDNVQIKRYFVSFWNGVDLRYKLLKGPKIRISIAGIIISRGRDATPYLERNRVGRDAIDSAAALTDMGKYLFRERRLPVYDIAVAVTKYDMCRRRKGGRCTKGTAGFAYVGGACVVNKRLEKVNSVAIIEDTGGFSGIIVAAHEVGHLLGAVHDGSPPPSYLGGPGAEKCRWEDGYIMSDLRHTEKGFKWSHCSVSSFHHFLNGDTATCLYNAPHEDEALPRVLPGKLLSLDAQCRKDRGTSACFKDDRVCAQLFCFDAGSGYCVAYRPAAEGSPCGDGQYCLNGKCVAEHENIIPDYTQNIPTYVRRDSIFSPTLHNRPIFAQYNSTDYRYPQDSTTQSTPLSKLKHSSPFANVIASTATTAKTTTTTTTTTMTTTTKTKTKTKTITTSTTTNPYKHVIAPFVVATPTLPKYTQTTVDSLCSNRYKSRYNDSSNGNSGSCNMTGNVSTTTKRSVNLFNSLHYTGSTVPKVTAGPFKYKNTVSVMSLSTMTKGYQKSLRNGGRGIEAGECTDIGSDCAELIDRLRTWLCHLQSVKSRCCASLKTICAD
ncbi:A disintegrin and metalloproteinase with thrombospondin motifs 1 isoform X2 [Harpegnathos saltator]|uniref:A disintegrin and metalloproteinase with thrombospondin motifs 1 isoform X2 n=1 Tax=Harpegnathos saltator TaxID=610380 RepID=UPI0005910D92|nr:A disintegrin and metalloproteinase with thrombospondin motifs 1 isoform X2 [Harpegnathos saltator]